MHPEEPRTSWLDRSLFSKTSLNWEVILFAVILLLAAISRFYILGTRVMSHDETSHVYFSWKFYRGDGYSHDPVTHGPLQFHLIALSYFLLGDSDFSARVPVALFGVAIIAFMLCYRRYLGRAGAVVAALLLLISPYILYYARYARNESYVALFGVVLLWAMLRYFESGAPRYLTWVTTATILHFITKETSYIYTAQALLFLGLYFVWQVMQKPWPQPTYRNRFLIALLIGVLLLAAAVGMGILEKVSAPPATPETAQPAVPGQQAPETGTPFALSSSHILISFSLLAFLAALFFLIRGYTLALIRAERSFDLLMLIGTLILPLLTAFPVKFLGWNPLDYTSTGMMRTGGVLILVALAAILLGLWWNKRLWLGNAALFWAIYTVFYTTLFTNGPGFFTGMVGGLGYWVVQQGVERGSQPWYYFLFLQIPVYEYLPALGSLLAFGFAVTRKQTSSIGRQSSRVAETATKRDEQSASRHQPLAVTLLGFWVLTSVFAYSYAGEKMPWLTVHITWSMILLTAWAIGRLIEEVDWGTFCRRRGVILLALLPIFFLSLTTTLRSLLGANPPFQGKELAQLQATNTFVFSLLMALASGWGVISLMKSWRPSQIGRVLLLTLFGMLALLTARTAIMASFINYDDATEYLVYAHSGPGNKTALAQIEEISRRSTDGLDLQVAYDSETTYPFWWYLRDYRNQRFFGTAPTRDLREAPVILVGAKNYAKIEPIVGQAYYKFSYIRMWWPDQDYWNLTWPRIWNAIRDRQWREAVFQIWFNRDYTKFGELKQRDMGLPKWSPSDEMRLYIRKDVAATLWNYGVGPSPEEVVADPYEGKALELSADTIWGSIGNAPGQFNLPRDLVLAPDGTIYVADTENHSIQHLTRDGQIIQVWGIFADSARGEAPGGTFNQPWGIAVSPDGQFVFVADTWNHRIQKFSAQGEFIKMWGYFGQAEKPDAFWGPRDVLIDTQNHLLVTDTGNKRIVIFDLDGNPFGQFGSLGFEAGQFDEPVGMALGGEGILYVADTWNQRIQSFRLAESGNYAPLLVWDTYAWFGNSLDNKPYLTVGANGHVFATDPEGGRVLEFTPQGEIVRFWGDFGTGPDAFGLAGAIAADEAGGLWVSDSGNNRIMHFTLPNR